MPMLNHNVYSSRNLLGIASAAAKTLNEFDLSVDRNVVVHAFHPADAPEWKQLPVTWHQFDGATIHLNMGKVYEAFVNSFTDRAPFGNPLEPVRRYPSRMGIDTAHGEDIVMAGRSVLDNLLSLMESRFNGYSSTGHYVRRSRSGNRHAAYSRDGRVNPRPIESTHPIGSLQYDWNISSDHDTHSALYNIIVGALIREAGYAVFTRRVFYSDWYARATGYQQNIITVFEELRVERQQAIRISGKPDLDKGRDTIARQFMRAAVGAVANVQAVIDDMSTRVTTEHGSGLSKANIALNSALILGRNHTETLMPFETKPLEEQVELYIDRPSLDAMHSIWERYVDITDADEHRIMELVREWEELFPSDESGENAKSSSAPAPRPNPKPEDGEGEGEGQGEGSDEDGEDGEGQGDGQGEGEGEGEGQGTDSGEGEGEGEGQGQGQEGEGKPEGDGSGQSDEQEKRGSTAQQERPDAAKDATGKDAGRQGTKGAQADSIGAKNTSGRNSGSKPGVDELIDTHGMAPGMADATKAGSNVTSTTRSATYNRKNFGPRDVTPSRISYGKAEHREPSRNSQQALSEGTEIAPNGSDHAAARELAKVLENLNVYDRGKFKVAQTLPPGRMKSRAAVQQAAERSLKLAPQAKPWSRTMRTVDMNPPLTVGIMTDVSGSQGWAEKLSARLAWIVQHAVGKVNGRTASLAFGEGVTVVLRPGERLERAQVVAADNGGEEFDMGAGTMDVMLNLVHGQGTRMLFVITDGYFVYENMLEKAKAWVDLLTSKGVHVVWITPDDTCMEPVEKRTSRNGHPLTPAGTIPVFAGPLRYARNANDRETEIRKLINVVGTEIQKAVRASKKH